MRFVSWWYVKGFYTAFVKTSAQCGFAKKCLKRYLQFLRGCKAAFYRCVSDGELVGSIAYFAGQSSAPDGWVLCDGSAVSRDTYATLFSAVGTTYGAGDGSTTFALPNLIDKFVEGSATAGTVKTAGLPNITGLFGNIGNKTGVHFGLSTADTAATGAFSVPSASVNTNDFSVNGGSTGSRDISFDASRSSSIYGNSTTVQPPALTMKPFIYTGKTSLNKWKRTA